MAEPLMVSKEYRVLLMPATPQLRAALPSAKALAHEGRNLLVAPHRLDETLLLRHLGYETPAPIELYYDWAGSTPFASQKTTAALLTTSPRAYVLNDLGTGKTRAMLFAIDWLIQEKQLTKVLVVAPLSTLTPVWAREIMQHFPHLRHVVLHGPKAKRQSLLARNDPHIYIINHDGIGVMEADLLERTDIDAVVIDELAVLRNQRTTRWKSFRRVCAGRRWVWGATGAPTPRAPTDAYAQVKLLTPDRVPRYYSRFQQETMKQVSQFNWVARPEAKNAVYKAMQPAVRFTLDECVDLPPISYVERDVAMAKPQAQLYAELSKRLHVMVQQRSITAANAGVLMNKLLQVACGHVYTDSGAEHHFGDMSRVSVTEELIESTERKTIVFVPFRHAVRWVHKELVARGHDAALVYGDTPRAERDKIFVGFQNGRSPRVIVAHPGTMAHGLTLTQANAIIWYSPTVSLETYEQANARIRRPGQTVSQLIVHLVGAPVEATAYTRLRSRQSVQDAILSLFKGAQAA
jgi:SNF2 family DNA or RNA helicase